MKGRAVTQELLPALLKSQTFLFGGVRLHFWKSATTAGLGSVSAPPPKANRLQKTKCAESSETGFHQVSQLYDLFSGGKRPFEIPHFLKMRNFERPFTPRN